MFLILLSFLNLPLFPYILIFSFTNGLVDDTLQGCTALGSVPSPGCPFTGIFGHDKSENVGIGEGLSTHCESENGL